MNKKLFVLITCVIFSLSLVSDPNLVFIHIYVNDKPNPKSNDNDFRPKLNSEEENIDSFDVSARSGRWNVEDNGAIDDRIIDSNLRIITSENDTDESSEYFANRGLRDSDGKVESRHKSSFNASTNDYSCSVLGDCWDWEEGDTEGFTYTAGQATTFTVSNGLAKFEITGTSGASTYFRFNNLDINTDVYNSAKIRIKGNKPNLLFIFMDDSNNQIGDAGTITESNTFETFTVSLVDLDWTGKKIGFGILFISVLALANFEGDEIFTIDYIELIGETDYATNEAGIGDTWDWEDSQEYFFDDFDNVSDFNDGSLEAWTGSSTTIFNQNSEYLNMTGSSLNKITNTSMSVDADTFKWLTIEFYSNVSVSLIRIGTSGVTDLFCSDSTSWTANVWNLFSCELDSDWSSTETELQITFTNDSNPITTLLNMVYLYTDELGDIEGWTALNSNDPRTVNPLGYMSYRDGLGGGDNQFIWPKKTGLNIDSSFFNILEINMRKINEGNTISYTPFNDLNQIGSAVTITSNFVTYTWDLSISTNWIGIITQLDLRSNAGWTVNGQLEIDYILLTSNETTALVDQSFTMGLWNQDSDQSLVNVSQRYFNSTLFRWEIELYDESGEISANFTSSNQTWIDEYYISRFDYNILETEFSVDLRDQDGSRILKVDYPEDFTLISIPSLFEHEKAPDLFFSTYTSFFGVSTVWLDFFNTKFKEREWEQINTPTDSDWNVDRFDFANVSKATTDTSTYRLVVPSLDFFSANLDFRIEDPDFYETSEIADIGDFALSEFTFYNSDKNGTLVQVFKIELKFSVFDDVGSANEQIFIKIYSGSTIYEQWISVALILGNGIRSSFSCSAINERQKLDCDYSFLVLKNGTDAGLPQGLVNDSISIDITDLNSEPSNEFILETNYDVEFDSGGSSVKEFQSKMTNFDFIQRDVFLGMVIPSIDFPSIDPIGILANIIKEIGLFLASIFKTVMEIFSVAVVGAVAALQPFLTAIQTSVDALKPVLDAILIAVVAVTAAVNLVTTAVDLVTIAVNAVETAVDFVTSAVEALGLLLDDVIQWLNDIFDFLDAFFADLLSWFFDDLWNEFLNLILSLWDSFWDLILPADVYAFLFGISVSDLENILTDIVNFIDWIGTDVLFWVMIAGIIIIWTAPMMRGQDPFEALNGVFEQSTNSFQTPNIWGFRVGIPFGLIVVLLIIYFMALGELPPIFVPF